MPRPAPNLPPQIAEGGIVAPRRQPRRSAVELLVSAATKTKPVEIQRARMMASLFRQSQHARGDQSNQAGRDSESTQKTFISFQSPDAKTEPVYKTGQGETRWVVRALVVRGARKRVALSVDVPQASHRLTKQRLRTLVITGVLRATTPQDAPGHSATESRSRFPARHIACQHWPTLSTAQEKCHGTHGEELAHASVDVYHLRAACDGRGAGGLVRAAGTRVQTTRTQPAKQGEGVSGIGCR